MNSELLEINEKAFNTSTDYPKKRFVFEKIKKNLKEKIFIGLLGPRGSGKTVLLKQLLKEIENPFYVSLDATPLDSTIYSLAEELQEKGIKNFLIDEIQFYPEFEKELKKIYDFLSIKIIFTGSEAIKVEKSSHDLSRRLKIIQVSPFSFREFILFEKNEEAEKISFEQILDEEYSRDYYGKTIKFERLFDDFLKGRTYPFTSGKADFKDIFSNILNRIISNDLLKSGLINTSEAVEIKKVIKFIGNSPAEDISYSSISKNLGITKFKAEKYVELLERSFILTVVFPRGTNVLKEPKILFTIPYRLIYKKFDDCIGALREDFFAQTMRFSGKEFFYLKTNRGKKTPDYLIDSVLIEIGGAKKGINQFKGFKAKEKIILTHPGKIDKNKRPLYFIGMID